MRAPNKIQRTAILGTLSVSAAIRGAAYIEAPNTGLIEFIDGVIPLWGWVLVWWVSAVALAVAAVWRPIVRVAMASSVSLWGLWTFSYLLSWASEGGRGWVTAGLMATIGVLAIITASMMEASRDHPVVE